MKALSATCGFTPSFPDIGGRRGPCEGSLFPFPAVSPLPPHGLPTRRQFDSRAVAETQNPGTPGSQGRGTDVFSMNASLALRRTKGNSGPGRGAGREMGGALSFFTTPQVR